MPHVPTGRSPLKVKVQVYCGAEIAMGPGKADLLEAIAENGSISGAARAMGMSYRRAWLLVDAMNRCWKSPLVLTSPGAGGARLSETGKDVLELYRSLLARLRGSARNGGVERLEALLLDAPRSPASQSPSNSDA